MQYIMSLAGHADEKTTKIYIDGHENKQPTKVAAGLDLSQVDVSEIDWINTPKLPRQLQELLSDSDSE